MFSIKLTGSNPLILTERMKLNRCSLLTFGMTAAIHVGLSQLDNSTIAEQRGALAHVSETSAKGMQCTLQRGTAVCEALCVGIPLANDLSRMCTDTMEQNATCRPFACWSRTGSANKTE